VRGPLKGSGTLQLHQLRSDIVQEQQWGAAVRRACSEGVRLTTHTVTDDRRRVLCPLPCLHWPVLLTRHPHSILNAPVGDSSRPSTPLSCPRGGVVQAAAVPLGHPLQQTCLAIVLVQHFQADHAPLLPLRQGRMEPLRGEGRARRDIP